MSLKNALSFYDPTVKTVQGANSTTFKNPGLDTNLTIPELFKFHSENSSEHAVFVYADDNKELHHLRYPEVYRAIRKAGTFSFPHVKSLVEAAEAKPSDKDCTLPVVGILAVSGAFLCNASCPTLPFVQLLPLA